MREIDVNEASGGRHLHTEDGVTVLYDPHGYESAPVELIEGSTAVVFDVLRATSTMVTALANGFRRVIPCRTIEEAFALKKASPQAVLAGERGGIMVEGFDRGNSPLEFRDASAAAETLIITTTNGTRAITAAKPASQIALGAFLNLDSLASWLSEQPKPWTVFCSGTFEDFAMEDALAAGALLEKCSVAHPVRELWEGWHASEPLKERLARCHNGRRLLAHGNEADIDWCAAGYRPAGYRPAGYRLQPRTAGYRLHHGRMLSHPMRTLCESVLSFELR